jgi:hypothetical protein
MSFEHPSLLPPDDLVLERGAGMAPIPITRCQLVAHNVAPDGKADPIDFDDHHFTFVYECAGEFFLVRGLNPEMMNGVQIDAEEADRLLEALPYRAVP